MKRCVGRASASKTPQNEVAREEREVEECL